MKTSKTEPPSRPDSGLEGLFLYGKLRAVIFLDILVCILHTKISELVALRFINVNSLVTV